MHLREVERFFEMNIMNVNCGNSF